MSQAIAEAVKSDALRILKKAHALEKWAYAEALSQPGLVDVPMAVEKFLKKFMTARTVWSAVQKSPRRTISGKNSALDYLGDSFPRSTLYKFLKQDLGFDTSEKMDQFRACDEFDEVVALSKPLNEGAKEIERLYDGHRAQIKAGGFDAEVPKKESWAMREKIREESGAWESYLRDLL